jgi:hypothetical protein
MSRTLTAMLAICLATAAPAAAIARPADPAPAAAGTRKVSLDQRAERARAVVDAHFQALERGDRAAIKRLWTRDAVITSVDTARASPGASAPRSIAGSPTATASRGR